MNLREEFKKEQGYDVMAIRQDYAGQRPYEDGFCDEYVEWLEEKVKNLTISDVSNNEVAVCEHDWHRTGDPDKQSCRCTKCGLFDE